MVGRARNRLTIPVVDRSRMRLSCDAQNQARAVAQSVPTSSGKAPSSARRAVSISLWTPLCGMTRSLQPD